MTSINDYSYSHIDNYDESDCETVFSNEEEEYIEEEEEEPYNEYDNDEYYYEHPIDNYISVKDNFKETETMKKIDMSIPKVNPWGIKLNEPKIEESKSFEEIIKEETEKKRLDEIKKKELEKVNKKRKERFSHSRQKFHFRSNQNSEKKPSLLLNLKTKN